MGALPRSSQLAAEDAGIVATKTEAVVHGHIYFSLNRLEGRVVQIAIGIGIF
jgi:hypothetical protein